MTESGWCSAYVYRPRVTSGNCSRRATVERDGALYCSIHDPVKVAAKRAEKQAVYKQAKAAAEKKSADAKAVADRMSKALGIPFHVRYTYGQGQTHVVGLEISMGAALNYLDMKDAP